MNSFTSTHNNCFSKVAKFYKKLPLFSFTAILSVDFDISVLLIFVMLVGVITFLAGTAYGIYLNDKISTKNSTDQLSGS